MADSTHYQLVTELSREIVTNVAPQELPIFRAQSQAYSRNPEKSLAAKPGKDDMLGFGPGEAFAFLTPCILAVMSSVVMFLTAEVKKAVKEQTASVITSAVKGLFKKYGPAAVHEAESKETTGQRIVLTAKQLDQVREIVINRARQLKVGEAKVDLLANSIVGSLV